MLRRRAGLPLLGSGIALFVLALSLFAVRPAPPRKPASDDLPATLHLQWVREVPAPLPAWPDQPLMQFDAAPEPVAAGDLVLLPSTRTDGVTAYDAETGAEVWRYTTDGPVRFAPAVGGDRAYIASDDGYLHCVSLHGGELLWKFRGGPSDEWHLLLVNAFRHLAFEFGAWLG